MTVRWEGPEDIPSPEDVEADARAAERAMGPDETEYDPDFDPWQVDPVTLCHLGYSPPQAMWDAWDRKLGDGIDRALNETSVHPVSGEAA